MANYSTLAQLKDALNIPAANVNYDTKLQRYLDRAYAIVNRMLRKWTSVPLADTVTDYQVIVQAEEMIAEGLYRMNLAEPERENADRKGLHLFREGKALIKDYIEGELKGEHHEDILDVYEGADSWDGSDALRTDFP